MTINIIDHCKSDTCFRLTMAIFSRISLFLFSFVISIGAISGTVITLSNSCSFPVWPGILSGQGGQLSQGGFQLNPGASAAISIPPGWSGRFWGRTGCNFDQTGTGHCLTGDCGGKLQCNGAGGAPPATLAEFTIGTSPGASDFYDVSLVDGYNVQLQITPQGGCQVAGCVSDVNAICPNELRVLDGASVVACKSACEAFNKPEFCCTDAYSKAETCHPTYFSNIFKGACPKAYSYAFDDVSSLFTCTTNGNYVISFCPH